MPDIARFLQRRLPDSLGSTDERIVFLLLAGSISLVVVSIAASQILLAAAAAGACYLWKKGKEGFALQPAIARPLVLFLLWTVAACFASREPLSQLTSLKKFFIFLVLVLTPAVARGRDRVLWILHATFAVSAVSAAAGLVQFAMDPHRDPLHRISGFMSQWMTYAGLLMLVLLALAAFVVARPEVRRSRWAIPLGLLLAASIYLSETRNAWLGAVAGLAVLFFLVKPRAIAGLAAALIVIYLLSPGNIQQRLRAGWNVDDPNTRNRIELFETAYRLIGDNPWFGVGPKAVGEEAPKYRGDLSYPDWLYQHMHNDFLQIAAERGIPGLILWLWLMIELVRPARRTYLAFRRHPAESGPGTAPWIASAAMACWVALLVSGMFEYNFGDSEVLTLFLFLMSAPSAAGSAVSTC